MTRRRSDASSRRRALAWFERFLRAGHRPEKIGGVAVLNVVVVQGVVSRPAQSVELPSGDRLVHVEVTVRAFDGPAESVPVVWFDPPAWAGDLSVGEEVLVAGRVRRRFFRAGGATQSRTEVVAATGSPGSSRRKVMAVLSEVVETLEGSAASFGAP